MRNRLPRHGELGAAWLSHPQTFWPFMGFLVAFGLLSMTTGHKNMETEVNDFMNRCNAGTEYCRLMCVDEFHRDRDAKVRHCKAWGRD